MPNTTLDQTVASLSVGELIELIRKTIREEFADLFAATNGHEIRPAPPPIRDIDTVIARMEATGKYNKKFLASLRKGMERSKTFQRAKTKSKP
ncbi:MAG: hypothetical protein ONB46_22660 [candidate division KSB1 bacterium]|nr:hypothetical protein [candidate division KSB1 bacterium]MDZ7368585.1 hypothetical protein [candidate division KSB1 bacterium]MDZ7406378.1 hypothetical protein [candidate division KSB1 bacterium]